MGKRECGRETEMMKEMRKEVVRKKNWEEKGKKGERGLYREMEMEERMWERESEMMRETGKERKRRGVKEGSGKEEKGRRKGKKVKRPI